MFHEPKFNKAHCIIFSMFQKSKIFNTILIRDFELKRVILIAYKFKYHNNNSFEFKQKANKLSMSMNDFLGVPNYGG